MRFLQSQLESWTASQDLYSCKSKIMLSHYLWLPYMSVTAVPSTQTRQASAAVAANTYTCVYWQLLQELLSSNYSAPPQGGCRVLYSSSVCFYFIFIFNRCCKSAFLRMLIGSRAVCQWRPNDVHGESTVILQSFPAVGMAIYKMMRDELCLVLTLSTIYWIAHIA